MKPKLHLFIVSTILLAWLPGTSNGQWASIKSIYGGSTANDGAASFVIGNKGYVVSGSSNNHVYEYDIPNNNWLDIGPIPSAAGHAFALSFVVNGKAYLVGGDTSGVPLATVWMFDPASSPKWIQKKDFPGGVRDAGITFTLNNVGYAGAGFDGASVHDDIWKYNDAKDTWTKVTNPLPTPLIFSASFVTNGKAFVLSGGTPPSGVNETQNMWEFDAASENWTLSAPFPGAARQAAFAFGNDAYGYLGGGMAGYSVTYNDMWQFDPVNKKWQQVQNAPLIGSAWASVFASGNTAYVGLGATFSGTGLTGDDKFYKYDMAATNGVPAVPYRLNDLNVYPNPVKDILHIDGLSDEHASLSVYDSYGKLVIQVTGEQVNTHSLAPGNYILRISEKNGQADIPFIKQ